MFLEEIPEDVKTTTEVEIRYDCSGGFKRCGQKWVLKYKDAQKNFDANDGKHICRQCNLRAKNPMKRKAVREKVKKTTLERHGTACVMNTAENVAKRNEKMFGTEEAVQEIVKKRRKTSQKRYGADHPMKSKKVQKKQKKAIRKKYGVDNPLQNAEVLKRQQQTIKERYGVDNIAQLPETRAKMAKTMFERYGVEHYNELPEMKDYLRENCTEWLKESYEAGGPNKGKPRPKEWSDKQSETVAKLIQSGKWMAGHKSTWRGHYKADKCKRPISFFRSGFELIYHWYLDHDPNVEWYDYEPFFIEYVKIDGSTGRYFPDFLVKYLGDDTLYLREVKADYLHDSLETKKKYEAAIAYVVSLSNMQFSILLKEDIGDLSLDLMSLIDSNRVVIVHDPRQ